VSWRGNTLPAAALLLGLGVWLAARGRPVEEARPDERVTANEKETAPARPTLAAALQAPPPRELAPAEPWVADDGLPIMPAAPDALRPDGPVHPHPITPAHRRIFRENRLVGALNGAMDVRDVGAMRALLAAYRADYPEDDEMLQDGYALIAECFENPGEATRAAARSWADTHRGSTLRRFVNRHCLEN
jgi:hypothetical protein